MGVFLLASNEACPIYAFGDNSDEFKKHDFRNWLLGAGEGVPLMWFFMFRPEHLHEYPRAPGRENDPAVRIPAATLVDATNTLLSRRALVNSWFGQRGALDRHVDVFVGWLKVLPFVYVTLDWSELCMEEGQAMADNLQIAIERIEARDASIVRLLAELSTTKPELGFPYLEGEPGSFSDEQMKNFWMLLGDSDGKAEIAWP